MVATCPPLTLPLNPDVSVWQGASSHSMMICPPDLYQDVACTDGMKLDRNASVPANWLAWCRWGPGVAVVDEVRRVPDEVGRRRCVEVGDER